jgi:hypothetical protein
MPIKPDVRARVQFKVYESDRRVTFRQPEAFYLTRAQVYDVDHLLQLYEGLYRDYPGLKPFVILVNPRFCEQDYTEKCKTQMGMKCIRLAEYMRRRGIDIPPVFYEKYEK